MLVLLTFRPLPHSPHTLNRSFLMRSGMCLARRPFSADACFISGVLFGQHAQRSVASCRVGVRVAEVISPRPLHGPDCSRAPTSPMTCCLKPAKSAAFTLHIYFLEAICSTVCRRSWIVLVLNLAEPENPACFVCRGKVS